jgi:hypothetical protein
MMGIGGMIRRRNMAVVTPDIAELFEEAYERAGLEMRSGTTSAPSAAA